MAELNKALVVAVFAAAAARPASAQSLSRFSLDSVVAVDLFRGENTVDRPNIVVDVTAVVRLANGWIAYVHRGFVSHGLRSGTRKSTRPPSSTNVPARSPPVSTPGTSPRRSALA